MSDRPTDRRNAPPAVEIDSDTTSREEMADAFRSFREFISLKKAEKIFIVKVPFDAEMNRQLKEIGAQFDPKTKAWRVRISAHRRLLEMAPDMQAIIQSEWFDALNADRRDAAKDTSVKVAPDRLVDFEKGCPAFVNGEEWVVTWVGRAQETPQGILHTVYLSKPAARSLPVETDFQSR